MASLIPIIQDLAPLVLPSSIHIASTPAPPPPPDTSNNAGQQWKAISQPIISGKSGHLHVFSEFMIHIIDTICNCVPPTIATIEICSLPSLSALKCNHKLLPLTTSDIVTHLPPNTSTTIRHHGEQDLVIHVLRGLPSFLSLTHGKVTESFLSVGTFVLVPAWTEYQISNGSELEEVVFVGTGSGREESVVELADWGGGAVHTE